VYTSFTWYIVKETKRLTDERLIEVRRIVKGDGVGLIEGIEEKGSLRLSFERVPN